MCHLFWFEMAEVSCLQKRRRAARTPRRWRDGLGPVRAEHFGMRTFSSLAALRLGNTLTATNVTAMSHQAFAKHIAMKPISNMPPVKRADRTVLFPAMTRPIPT